MTYVQIIPELIRYFRALDADIILYDPSHTMTIDIDSKRYWYHPSSDQCWTIIDGLYRVEFELSQLSKLFKNRPEPQSKFVDKLKACIKSLISH